MKNGKIILGTIALITAFGSAFAFNLHKNGKVVTPNIFTTSTCVNVKPCSKIDVGAGPCLISLDTPVYTLSGTPVQCRLYTGNRFANQ